MKKILILLFLCLISISSANDAIELRKKERLKQYFIDQAEYIIADLYKNSTLIEFNDIALERERLEEYLLPENIEISTTTLIDNTGSLVDAIGVPEKVILDESRWQEMQISSQDNRILVLHELFRISSINDDNFILSRYLYHELTPLESETKKITPYCNLRVSETYVKVKEKTFRGAGSAVMPSGNRIIYSSFQVDKSMTVAMRDVKEKCSDAGYYYGRYVSGNTIMSSGESGIFQGLTFKAHRKKETKVKVKCFKDQIKARKKRDVKKERCLKISNCRENIRIFPDIEIQQEYTILLDQQENEYRCEK
jgi:hypothetical protein